jgi:SAM-dependent methyltransferase
LPIGAIIAQNISVAVNTRSKPVVRLCEADVAEGLEEAARGELLSRLGGRATVQRLPAGDESPGAVRFTYAGDLRDLLRLRTVHAVSLLRRFGVPRPKALLGDQHFRAVLADIALARNLWPASAFATLHLSAAGSDSSVMTRLKQALAQATGLAPADGEGDLALRIRRSRTRGADSGAAVGADPGWEVLVRLSPRPLATRAWRVCNLEGALNAAVARAMVLMTRPAPDDIMLNLACGSGTLLAERLDAGPARLAIGIDRDRAALDCARANLAALGKPGPVALLRGDAGALPLPDRSADAVCADLPFGHLVGSHAENVALYPRVLAEAARVARPGARFAALTHEVRLMESLLGAGGPWTVEKAARVELGGLYPRIFVLLRAG